MDRQYDQQRCELLREGSPTALLLLGEEAATGRTDCPATLNAVSTRKVLSRLNEFYEKESQEKSSPQTGVEI